MAFESPTISGARDQPTKKMSLGLFAIKSSLKGCSKKEKKKKKFQAKPVVLA